MIFLNLFSCSATGKDGISTELKDGARSWRSVSCSNNSHQFAILVEVSIPLIIQLWRGFSTIIQLWKAFSYHYTALLEVYPTSILSCRKYPHQYSVLGFLKKSSPQILVWYLLVRIFITSNSVILLNDFVSKLLTCRPSI